MDSLERVTQIVMINDLLARFAQAADLGSLEEYGALITPDFTWEFPGNSTSSLAPQVVQGRDEVLRAAQDRRDKGIQGPGTATRHVISSIAVTPHPTAPTSTSYLRYYRNTEGVPALQSTNVYYDTFRQASDGDWLLHHRRIVFV